MPADLAEAAQWGALILELLRDGEVVRTGEGRITSVQLASGEAACAEIGLALADGRGVDPAEWHKQSVRSAGLPDPDDGGR
jgi:hypothetical protein